MDNSRWKLAIVNAGFIQAAYLVLARCLGELCLWTRTLLSREIILLIGFPKEAESEKIESIIRCLHFVTLGLLTNVKLAPVKQSLCFFIFCLLPPSFHSVFPFNLPIRYFNSIPPFIIQPRRGHLYTPTRPEILQKFPGPYSCPISSGRLLNHSDTRILLRLH